MGKTSQSTLKKYKTFADAYVSNGHHGTNAAISAGYAEHSAYSKANALLKIVEVQEFITQFEKKVGEEFLVTAKGQYEKHQKVYDLALADGQYSAANSAVKAQSELCGVEAPKKTETTINSDNLAVINMEIVPTKDRK